MKEHISTEAEEQEGFLTWFHHKYPSILIYHCPNGEHRSISTAVRLKKQGVVKGIPDLMIPAWFTYIELKRVKGGKLSVEQENIISYLRHIGYVVIVGYGATDASRQILELRELSKND